MVSHISRFSAELITDGHNNRVVDAIGQDVIKFSEDFVNTPLATDNIQGWTTTLVEAGSGESTMTLDDASGGNLLLTTDNASGDGLNAQRPPESFRIDNNSLYFGARFKMDDATNTALFIGLSVDDTAILTNLGKRIGFSKASGATSIGLDFKKTNTTSSSALGTLANDTFMIVELLYDKDAGKLYVYVNGAEVAVLTSLTNLPDTEIKPSIHFKTGTTAAKNLRVDWIRCFQFGRA